jgi:hypothetical protein
VQQLAALAAGALWLGAAPARALPEVYYDPSGGTAKPGYPPALPKGSSAYPVDLVFNPGSQATAVGVACDAGEGVESGNGEESCGFDITVQGSGDLVFSGYSPLSPFGTTNWTISVEPCQEDFACAGCTPEPTCTTLHAAMLTMPPGPPGPVLGPVKLGTLFVDTTTAGGGRVRATSVENVSAGLALRSDSGPDLAFVPEPGAYLLIVSGVAGLGLLHRLRERSRR